MHSRLSLFERAVLMLYQLGWYLLLPLVILRLWWRGRIQPEYRQHIAERFGLYPSLPEQRRTLWVHAVSVGETRAAEPLIRQLLADYPDARIVLTHMTPTGRATSQALFADCAQRVIPVYLPYDIPLACRRFIQHFQPQLGVLMETEIWPTLINQAAPHFPVTLVNARLSARSARGYQRLRALISPALRQLALVAAQTPADAERLSELGADKIAITGNMKFDIAPPEGKLALGETFRAGCGCRPIVLAASTREGEEVALLQAFARYATPEALLLLVPRHPQRFAEVAALAQQMGLPLEKRSETTQIAADTRVWLGDSMGEMFAYYAASDVALLGGSFLPFGGQNLIEACAVGTPVLFGPHTFNFQQIAEDCLQANAGQRFATADAAMQAALQLAQNPAEREPLSQAARIFAAQHRGATRRTVEQLQPLLAR